MPIFLITLSYIILFLFLRGKLLFTPDFGESDAYHLNLSLKYLLSQSLKHNNLPFWTDKLQGGFPIFAEGQIGALFLPNIFFLKFFKFTDSYNLLLIFSLFCLTLGFYFLLIELGVRKTLSVILSYIFTFNGAISLRWVHLNLIQTFSIIPWLFLFLIKLLKENKKIYYILFPVFLAETIFAGHLQTVFIGLLSLILWFLFYLKEKKQFTARKILLIFFLILSGLILALPQLLPTARLATFSSRVSQFGYALSTSFPFPIRHIISFVYPFAFGNAKTGTYPAFNYNWGIFWENTPLLGLPFVLILIFVFTQLFLKKNLPTLAKYSLLLSVLLLLLAFGKDSPLYFIFAFFPFNIFRTPSRYLMMVNFFLILASAEIVNVLFNKNSLKVKFSIYVLLLINVIVLIQFTFNYHLWEEAKSVLKKPEIAKVLDNNFYLTFGEGDEWNKIFLKNGWNSVKAQQSYLYFKNYLYPNSNLLYGNKSFGINSPGLDFRRVEYFTGFINDEIADPSAKEIDINKPMCNIFKLYGISQIITSYTVKGDCLSLVKTIKDINLPPISLWKTSQKDIKFYYQPRRLIKISTVTEFMNDYEKNNISMDTARIEDYDGQLVNNDSSFTVENTIDLESNKVIAGRFSKNTFLAFRIFPYNNWSIKIDGKKTKIYKINIIQSGVFIPAGQHTVSLDYKDEDFQTGMMISVIFFSGLIISKYLLNII